ncbi:MAG: DUF3788 domain-containing protein [Chloroflexota bacterium]
MSRERLIDKTATPSDADMIVAIGPGLAGAWTELRRFLAETYDLVPELQFGGPRYGWNLKYRKGGRPLCDLSPERGSFTALVILGKKELDQALERLDSFGALARQALLESPRFHDGCWMYLHVEDLSTCQRDAHDIQQLILIKKKPPRKKAAAAPAR